MKSKLTENIIITLVVLGMLSLAITALFLFTKDSTYAVDINNQNNQTNSVYATFDVGFENAAGQIEHSIVADVNPEYKSMHIIMGLAENYTLVNPKVQFYDSSNGANLNFNLGSGFGKMTGQYIKETNDTYKYIQFEDLTQGINYRFDMSTVIGNEIALSKLNETSKAVFTATLRDPSGNTTAISKEIYFNIGWTANLSMSMSQTVENFTHTKVGSEDNLVVETELIAKINTTGKYNILPVKQTEIIVDAPTYKGIAPKSVTVTAKKTGATNGKTGTEVVFDTSNWNYNQSTRKLTITVNNNPVSGKVTAARGYDEYNITYTYPQSAYDVVDTSGVDIANKVSGTMTLYSNTSTIAISGNIDGTLRLTNYVTANTNGTLHKSPLYFNTLKAYTNNIGMMFTLTYKSRYKVENSKTKILFEQMKFRTEGGTEYTSFVDAVNYAPITKFQVPVNSFSSYFGGTGTGTIEIYEDDTTLIGTITSSTTTQTEDGETYYVFTIPENIRKRAEKISLVIGTPANELAEIKIEIYREISKDLPYTIKQIQTFKQTYEAMKNYHTNGTDNTNFIYESDNDFSMINDFIDTYTNADISIQTTTLKAEPGAQKFKFDITLDNAHFDTDVWSEPYFDIVLPEYITGVGSKLNTELNMSMSDTVYFGSYFYSKKVGNNWHLLIPLQNTHKAVFNKQTKLTAEIDVYVDKFATNSTKEIKMYYINNLATTYKNPDTWQVTPTTTGEAVTFPVLDDGTASGIASTEINFVAEPNLLCVSEISEYFGANTINSIDNKDTAAEISRTGGSNPKMTLIAQNNHTVPVTNAVLLGRIPYTDNKYAIANTSLGTNINTTLSSLLTTTSTKNITIYYSDNLDATKDITLASNNWVTNPASLATIKSYLIVIHDTMQPGEQIRFTYNFKLPTNIYYNRSLYANFGGYYTAGDTDRTSESSKIGLATNRGPILKLSKVATITSGNTKVKEGDIITYKLTIENNGAVAAENVVIKDLIPSNTTYVKLNEAGKYVEDATKTEVEYNIESLGASTSIIYTFSVKVNEITENINIENIANAEADGVDKIDSNVSSIPAIPTRPNLSITKTSNIDEGKTVGEGDKITYTITVRNSGDGNAKNVVITDAIPENTSYYNTETKTVDATRTEVTNTKDIIAPGEMYTYTFTVEVKELTGNTTIQNIAKVKADNNAEVTSNTVSINAVKKVPNLEITKTSDLAEGISVKEGDIITYTITVKNKGTGVAKNVIITDTIPEGTIYYDTTTNSAKEDIKVINSSVRETLEPEEGFNFTFKVQVGRISANKTIQNTAKVKADNSEEKSSNTVGTNASTTKPTLRATKASSIAEGTVVKEGSVITYTITVENIGTMPAYDVTIKDTVPQNTTYYENNTRNSEMKSVGKNIEKLEPGQSESYSFTVIVDEITSNMIIENTAKVNAENGEETSSNTVSINAVPKEASLEVVKTSDIATGTTVKEGDLITYTIRVRNIGDGVANNIIIKDTIPTDTIYYDEATNTVNSAIKTINSETKAELNPEETFTFSFKVKVGRITANKVISNIAKVQNGDKGEVASNVVNINAVTTRPNLRITKTSSIPAGTTIKAGDQITYTITVENIGAAPAYNVSIKDVVPEHTTYYENNAKNPSKKNVGKDISVLNSGQSESYSFTVIVDEITENANIRNTAKVSAESWEETPTNTIDITAQPKKANLVAIKNVASPEIAREGDFISYIITVTNRGDGVAKNVKITDTIPEGTFYYNENTSAIEKETRVVNSEVKETLEPNASFSYEFRVQVGRISSERIIQNTAKVTSDNFEEISTNTTSTNAGITVPNLRITKTSNIPEGTKVKEGDKITYTITVENIGETPAYDVEIKDIVPAHTTLYENNSKNPEKRNVGKTISSINPGESDNYSFTVIVDEISEKNVKIENEATVIAENGEEKTTNKVDIETILSAPKLKVTKTSNVSAGTTLKEGDKITYTITVENVGTVPAYNVEIKDKVPENTTYYENDEKNPSKKNVGKTIEVLNPGQSDSYTFTVIIEEITGKTKIKNTATVTSENGEEKPSNEIEIDVIGKMPNLQVIKTTDIPAGKTVKEGDIITYTITVKNTGGAEAKNVMIKDTIPEGTIYYDMDTNTLKPSIKQINSEVKETLAPNASFEFKFKVQVGRVSVGKKIENTATVVGDNVEDTPSNTEGVTAEISVPELKLEKKSSVQEGQTIESGDIITYTIVATNTGNCIAHNVVISDRVPEHTVYVEKMGDKYVKDENKKDIRKEVEALQPGETATLTFNVMVGELSGNVQITNQARVDANNFEGGADSNMVGISAKPKDSGKKGGDLPYTGKYQLIIIAIVGTISVTVFAVYEHKRIKRR